jgi:hypothetical protein
MNVINHHTSLSTIYFGDFLDVVVIVTPSPKKAEMSLSWLSSKWLLLRMPMKLNLIQFKPTALVEACRGHSWYRGNQKKALFTPGTAKTKEMPGLCNDKRANKSERDATKTIGTFIFETCHLDSVLYRR